MLNNKGPKIEPWGTPISIGINFDFTFPNFTNQSLKSGIFPNELKIAKVTLIYKKDDKKVITNYRPISVMPVVSKVFETVIHEQLSDYFLTNNLFSAQQYGFGKTHPLN